MTSNESFLEQLNMLRKYAYEFAVSDDDETSDLLTSSRLNVIGLFDSQAATIAQLQLENEKLREALKAYAKPNIWWSAVAKEALGETK